MIERRNTRLHFKTLIAVALNHSNGGSHADPIQVTHVSRMKMVNWKIEALSFRVEMDRKKEESGFIGGKRRREKQSGTGNQ